MKRICLIFGHHNTKDSFNAAMRDAFIDEAEKIGHKIDLINLFDEEEQLPFYRTDINPPTQKVLDYRERLEKSDVMFLMSACHNLRMSGITENWIDWFTSKMVLSIDRFYPIVNFGKSYYPVPGAMKNKIGVVSMIMEAQ